MLGAWTMKAIQGHDSNAFSGLPASQPATVFCLGECKVTLRQVSLGFVQSPAHRHVGTLGRSSQGPWSRCRLGGLPGWTTGPCPTGRSVSVGRTSECSAASACKHEADRFIRQVASRVIKEKTVSKINITSITSITTSNNDKSSAYSTSSYNLLQI